MVTSFQISMERDQGVSQYPTHQSLPCWNQQQDARLECHTVGNTLILCKRVRDQQMPKGHFDIGMILLDSLDDGGWFRERKGDEQMLGLCVRSASHCESGSDLGQACGGNVNLIL